MIQVLKLGFSDSSLSSFFVVSYRRTKLCGPFSAGLKMGSRKCSSAPATAKLGDESNIDVSKPQMTTSKTRVKKSGVLEDDSDNIEKMTLQQIKSRLRSIGIPAKGAKNELLSTLKSYMDSQIDGAGSGSSSLQDLVVSNEKPAATRTNSKRKAKELPERDSAQIKKNDVDISGGETSIPVKKKVLSRITTANIEAHVDVVVSIGEPWTVLSHKKPEKGWTAYNPKIMRPPPIAADMPHVKLMSWNVNGLRALLKLESFSALQLAKRESFDVLCLQETKLQEKDVDAIRQTLLEGYDNSYWTCSVSKLGYSGTAIISRIKPLSVRYGLGISDHDNEGRLVTVEFDNFYLLSGYVPNSGDGLRRLSYRITQWDPSLSNYMKDLERSKPVVLTGDLNCAHQEIDIWNPAGNKRSAGFTDEERQSFQTNFLDRGFVDTFRKQHPDIVGYTYWGYRHGGRKANKGWRLDYFLASESIANQVYDSYILPDVSGSDHSPIGLILKL